ncbi:hypothetical protein ABMA28_012770, partial [Loxostege sticticalis]
MLRAVAAIFLLASGAQVLSLDLDCPRNKASHKAVRVAGCSCDVTVEMFGCPGEGQSTPGSVLVRCYN